MHTNTRKVIFLNHVIYFSRQSCDSSTLSTALIDRSFSDFFSTYVAIYD